MLLTDNFVFIHIPKTAGMFIKTLCERYGPSEWHIQDYQGGPYGDHSTREHIPQSHQNLPLISSVRNPWDWYVSWFFYHQVTGPSEFYNRISNNGQRDFKDSITALLEENLTEHFASVYGAKVEGTAGLYGETAKLLLGNELEAEFCRFENLRESFLDCVSHHVAVPENFRQQFISHKKININPVGDYRQFYDDVLIDRVAQAEHQIVEKFSYVFG